jgi:hypothetical protein
MAVVLQLIDLNKKHEVVPCEVEAGEIVLTEKTTITKKKQKIIAGAMVWILKKVSVTKKESTRRIYLLLGCFLLLVIAGIFLHLSLTTSIFAFALLLVIFYPKRLFSVLLPISLALLLSSVIALAFSQKDWASAFYLWMLLAFVLTGMAMLIEFFGKKIVKLKC